MFYLNSNHSTKNTNERDYHASTGKIRICNYNFQKKKTISFEIKVCSFSFFDITGLSNFSSKKFIYQDFNSL